MRIDWQHLLTVSSELGSPDSLFLVAIPLAGRDLLLSNYHALEWEATYRTAGYDYSDWDALQGIVAETVHGLQRAEKVLTIVEQLTRIADALEKMEVSGDESNTSLGGILSILTLIYPEIGILLQLIDSIDDVMGGAYEPPPPLP